MESPRVVLDTNVLVAALRSRRGASFKLMSLLAGGRFEVTLSVPLLLEYQDVLARHLPSSPLDQQDLEDFLDFLCSVAQLQRIFFLWRPYLKDPKDDMVLELAVAAQCEGVVTHNLRDFSKLGRFGLEVYSPATFLTRLGETS